MVAVSFFGVLVFFFIIVIFLFLFAPSKKQPRQPRQKKHQPPKQVEFIVDGITKDDLNRIVRSGKAQVRRIEDAGFKIKKHLIRQDVIEICYIAQSIFENFEKDPKDIKVARQFLNYYLDTCEKIVTKYVELSSSVHLSDEINGTMEKVEHTLVQIKETFRKQYQKVLEDDVLDLETEIKVLQQTMKSEGI